MKKTSNCNNLFFAKKEKHYKRGSHVSYKTIAIESTCESFSSNSGLFLLNQLWKSLRLAKKFKSVLPRKKRNKGLKQVDRLKALVFSFAMGNDSLSDLDQLNQDNLFRSLIGGNCSSTSMGDFLRSFGPRQVEKFQEVMMESVIELRLAIFSEDKKFVLTMDSTPHEHFAKKMEGLDWNYKDMWCLDSQNVYDQYGFSYLFDLRPGNTFSGKKAERWIHLLFKKIPKQLDRWFRADSAYSNFKVFEALKAAEINFAIALKENIGSYVRKKNKHLLTWKKTKLRFFESNKCEVAMGIYPIKKLGNLRVVFIRAPREEEQLNFLDDPQEQGYKHYSIITNVSTFDMGEEEIIEFYRQRATAENYIREQKYGFDFLNFPCQKLRANQVFGQAGSIAHNLIRVLSFMMEQKVKKVKGKDGKRRVVTQLGYYSKKVRSELLNIAGKVVSSARKIKLRVSRNNEEVMRKVMNKIKVVLQRYVSFKNLERVLLHENIVPNCSYGPEG